jgi:DnaJ family protein A protein 2
MRQRGFLVEQIQVECTECRGNGEIMKGKDRCKTCKGNKVTQEKKSLDLYIDKGMNNKQKIVFSGEGDQHPEIDAGDIIFVIHQKDHPVFTREGANLIMTKEISLVEALCGFSFILTHLDGRHLNIKTSPGQVISPDQTMCIENEGMPTYRSIYDIGKLIIKFHVIFPEKIDVNLAKKLQDLLPKPPQDVSMESENTENLTETEPEEHFLTPYVQEEKNSHHQHHYNFRQHEDDDEDEEHEGGQRVQCAQQ